MAAISIVRSLRGSRNESRIFECMDTIEEILFGESRLVRFVGVTPGGDVLGADMTEIVRRVFEPVRGLCNGWIARIDRFVNLGVRPLPIDDSEAAQIACAVLAQLLGTDRRRGELYVLLARVP
jgi:hypothetical protein